MEQATGLSIEQREHLIELIRSGADIAAEWARLLFPPERREYELTYHGKEREADVIADTIAVPLQKVRTFGTNGKGWHNKLIFGDNLQVMKTLLAEKQAGRLRNADGTDGVKLIYIDPPFATKSDFSGSDDARAFGDRVAGAEFIEFLRRRFILMRELLSDDGALYVHLDQKKVHYIKAVLDEVFGEGRMRNEIIWHYRFRMMDSDRKFNKKHDTILFYAKSEAHQIAMPKEEWTRDEIIRTRKQEIHVDKKTGKEWVWMPGGKGNSKNKRKFLEEIIAEGKAIDDVWEIPIISSSAEERTGYPTQKPERLLERIVLASSTPGDIVMDAFAGAGTTTAVAERLGRRWIAIDCGKLSIYTIQKRMLNLKAEVGNKGRLVAKQPFALYNAGLYDFSRLRDLSVDAWRFFALQLFQCKDEPHRIGGIALDGRLKGASVLVFRYQSKPGVRIDEETIQSLHAALGSKITSRFFIIAPSMVFDFQQDYLTIGGIRYYALRIPYSIINELHKREFKALTQPSDELAVNETVDAVGFDFIRRPELEFDTSVDGDEAVIRVRSFRTEAAVKVANRKVDRDSLSMVLCDFDFDAAEDVFDLDAVFYADSIAKANWEVRFPLNALGKSLMVVFMDVYGNEAREVIPTARFRPAARAKPSSLRARHKVAARRKK